MFVSTYIGFMFGAALISGGLGYYVANRGTCGVKIDLDNIKADVTKLKSAFTPTPPPVMIPVTPVVAPVVTPVVA